MIKQTLWVNKFRSLTKKERVAGEGGKAREEGRGREREGDGGRVREGERGRECT